MAQILKTGIESHFKDAGSGVTESQFGAFYSLCNSTYLCGACPVLFLNNRHAGNQKTAKESVMKCSNPDWSRGIGLVAYRRGWFSKRRHCSLHCRDADAIACPKQTQQERNATSYFEWLFLEPISNPYRS
jgi:hypothetical protein